MTARHRALWAVIVLLSLALLMVPALWNGFPLIFPDTGGYLMRPLAGTLELGRSAFYGLFLAAGMRLAFWPNVIAQVALTLWLIVLTLRALGFGGRPWLALGIVLLLTIGSSLPWVAGLLIPDVLFHTAVLALFLLIFAFSSLAVWERFALGGVIASAIASHMAAAALCAALVTALWPLARLMRDAWPRARVCIAAYAVAAGIVLCPVSNWAITGHFAFTPGGMSFFFARILDSGIVARYLGEHCPDPALQLCAYQGVLEEDADSWLWDADSPFRTLKPKERDAAEKAIILATLARYPMMHITTAVQESVAQSLSFRTEVDLDDNWPTIYTFASQTPWLMPQFMRARQQHDAIDVAMLNWLHVPVAALAMLGTAGALVFRRALRLTPATSAFCSTVLLSLVLNAAICGVFSHSVDRYQSRLMPLALLALAILVFDRQRRSIE